MTTTEMDPIQLLQTQFESYMECVNEIMDAYMDTRFAPIISKITRHLMDSGGKRIRPLLAIAASDYNGNLSTVNPSNEYMLNHPIIRLAAAIEFIHTATLLHDDVIDESPKRRGVPTANSVWGNKYSILVGDFLFSKAFRMMLDSNIIQALPIIADAVALITEKEVVQLDLIGDIKSSIERYTEMISGKTAALFAASCEVGAITASASAEVSNAFKVFGHAFGMAFQIVDDILDYQAQSVRFGKEVGVDFYEGKITAPIIGLLELASKNDLDIVNEIFAAKERQEPNLALIQNLLLKYDAFKMARGLAEQYVEEGIAAISHLEQKGTVPALVTLMRSTTLRTY